MGNHYRLVFELVSVVNFDPQERFNYRSLNLMINFRESQESQGKQQQQQQQQQLQKEKEKEKEKGIGANIAARWHRVMKRLVDPSPAK